MAEHLLLYRSGGNRRSASQGSKAIGKPMAASRTVRAVTRCCWCGERADAE